MRYRSIRVAAQKNCDHSSKNFPFYGSDLSKAVPKETSSESDSATVFRFRENPTSINLGDSAQFSLSSIRSDSSEANARRSRIS